jgi:hypothetical protein
MHKSAQALIAGVALLLSRSLAAAVVPPVDLTGTWSIQMQVTGAGGQTGVGCAFQGSAEVSQTGSNFTGDISANQTAGPVTCPSAMAATLSGQVVGSTVNMGAVMGSRAFGVASFVGTISGLATRSSGAARPAASPTVAGTFAVTSGPFSGLTGTWSAARAAIAAVPALDLRGLAVLGTLLLIAAFALLKNRAPRPGR